MIVADSGTSFSTGLAAPLKTVFSGARYAALVFGANDAPARSLVDGFRSNCTEIIDALRVRGRRSAIAAPSWATDLPARQASCSSARPSGSTSSWIAKTYAAGDYVWNGAHAYRCTTEGTSATGPTGTGTGIADGGTARWAYLPTLREDYAADSSVIPGPDLYTVFLDHPEWLGDGLRPNATGEIQWRNAWVAWASSTLYVGIDAQRG